MLYAPLVGNIQNGLVIQLFPGAGAAHQSAYVIKSEGGIQFFFGAAKNANRGFSAVFNNDFPFVAKNFKTVCSKDIMRTSNKNPGCAVWIF